MINRRQLLAAGAATLAGLGTLRARAPEHTRHRASRGSIPLVHITDLYHPPQDPDDHFDLATIAALKEYDLKAVILDVTERFLDPPPNTSETKREPGFIPVTQLGFLVGRSIPIAMGPREPLKSPADDISDRSRQEQAGVHLLLDTLENTKAKVVVSSVGSCRVLAAACNQNPGLLRSRVKSILLVAGSSGGSEKEWNVGLDIEAYKALWRSGLPIHWFPCATERGSADSDHERATYWKTTHAALFLDISSSLQAWFAYALTRSNRPDFIRALAEKPAKEVWDGLLPQERNLWSTVPLVMAAERVLARMAEGWRFVPADEAGEREVWPWRLDAIEATVDEQAQILWRLEPQKQNAFLFGREKGKDYPAAMAEALNALLRSLSS